MIYLELALFLKRDRVRIWNQFELVLIFINLSSRIKYRFCACEILSLVESSQNFEMIESA